MHSGYRMFQVARPGKSIRPTSITRCWVSRVQNTGVVTYSQPMVMHAIERRKNVPRRWLSPVMRPPPTKKTTGTRSCGRFPVGDVTASPATKQDHWCPRARRVASRGDQLPGLTMGLS